MNTEIYCGQLAPGEAEVNRKFVKYVEFFQREVEIFYACTDSLQRMLFKSSDLAKHISCDHSRLGMYLRRNATHLNGLYKASALKNKNPRSTGLRVGGYFLSLECCASVFEEFKLLDTKKERLRVLKKTRIPFALPVVNDPPLALPVANGDLALALQVVNEEQFKAQEPMIVEDAAKYTNWGTIPVSSPDPGSIYSGYWNSPPWVPIQTTTYFICMPADPIWLP